MLKLEVFLWLTVNCKKLPPTKGENFADSFFFFIFMFNA